jgi:hypothetical protein
MLVAGSGTRSEPEGASAVATSPGIEITTGPRSATAVVIAVLTMGRSCLGLTSRPTYRAEVLKNAYGFNSSSASESSSDDSTSPQIAMIGVRSRRASSRPLTRCATPGPAVPQTATGLPVRRASATAANTPYSSLRTWTKSTEPLRRSASITGFSASPTIP